MKSPYLNNSKINKISLKSMMSTIPKITSILSLNCVIKTSQSPSNKKKPILKIKPWLYWNKSSLVINRYTITILYIEISNLRTFLCRHIHLKLLILGLLSNIPISKKDKTIMSVHPSTCRMKPLMITSTASKVISGPLVSFSMKCWQEELHGEQKLNQISKECSNQILSKLYFHQKFQKFQNNSL